MVVGERNVSVILLLRSNLFRRYYTITLLLLHSVCILPLTLVRILNSSNKEYQKNVREMCSEVTKIISEITLTKVLYGLSATL